MKRMGIKRVYYSNLEGEIVCQKLKHIGSTYDCRGTHYAKKVANGESSSSDEKS